MLVDGIEGSGAGVEAHTPYSSPFGDNFADTEDEDEHHSCRVVVQMAAAAAPWVGVGLDVVEAAEVVEAGLGCTGVDRPW